MTNHLYKQKKKKQSINNSKIIFTLLIACQVWMKSIMNAWYNLFVWLFSFFAKKLIVNSKPNNILMSHIVNKFYLNFLGCIYILRFFFADKNPINITTTLFTEKDEIRDQYSLLPPQFIQLLTIITTEKKVRKSENNILNFMVHTVKSSGWRPLIIRRLAIKSLERCFFVIVCVCARV